VATFKNKEEEEEEKRDMLTLCVTTIIVFIFIRSRLSHPHHLVVIPDCGQDVRDCRRMTALKPEVKVGKVPRINIIPALHPPFRRVWMIQVYMSLCYRGEGQAIWAASRSGWEYQRRRRVDLIGRIRLPISSSLISAPRLISRCSTVSGQLMTVQE
jgi:hypothetical protein